MAYCLEKRIAQEKGGVWRRYAVCGNPRLLERVRLGQKCPEHWRVVLERTSLKKAG